MAIAWTVGSGSDTSNDLHDNLDGLGWFASSVDEIGPLAAVAARSGFRGTLGELLRGSDSEGRVHAVGGIGVEPDGRGLRRAAADVARALRHCQRVRLALPSVPEMSTFDVARAVAEGAGLGLYRFVAHKREPDRDALSEIELVHSDDEDGDPEDVRRALRIAEPIIDAAALARDLANETPARMTAAMLADVAVTVAAASDLAVEVWDEHRIVDERLGCLLAVNAGSTEPARVIRLDYEPSGGAAGVPHVVLVGKGITFDSGGLSLKRPAWMYDMKGDMGGAAAVIAALGACRALDVPIRVTGIVMATDNLPGPDATKPGEIVHARNGTSVEILDTDAEGRLVLADGLCLAAELTPDAILDVATLTGYGRVLGSHFTPVMTNDDSLAARLEVASQRAGEPTWRLPLPEEFVEALESPWADLRNIPDPDDAGTIAPGVFLRHFAGGHTWAHLDIGETGFSDKTRGDVVKGCTGAMVRTLCEVLRTWETVQSP